MKIPSLLLLLLSLLGTAAQATDLVRNAGGASGMATTNVMGLAQDPLAIISGNPALLTGQDDGFQLSLTGLVPDSTFTSKLGERDEADPGPGIIPEAALVWSPGNARLTLGAAMYAQSAMSAEFDFVDPPGTLGVSYGNQTHRAEYVVYTGVVAVGLAVSERLSVGANVGLSYNRNQLTAPYSFQSHPVLQGLKVLVALDVDDVAPTATVGLNYRLTDSGQLNLAYQMQTEFAAHGDLDGNLARLGLGIQEDFSYNARVSTALPARASIGYAWTAGNRWDLGLQYDRIFWESAFDELPIALTSGNNGDLNAFLGIDRIDDVAPLDWRDQNLVSLAATYRADGTVVYRVGFQRTDIPVPDSTVTPLTAAILKNAVSFGVGFRYGETRMDLSYRYSFSASESVGTSGLLGGEYTNTRQDLNLHSVGLSIRF